MNILYLSAHSILEFDEVRLFTQLGHDVFSPGAYIRGEGDGKRPALTVPEHPELIAAMEAVPGGVEHAKANLPDALIDWADAIIVSAFEHTWIAPQWRRIKGKRVIWRTIGQSVEHNERMMAGFFRDGLEIVRYSPKERNIPGYAGESALIRFAKDPTDWHGWTGHVPAVINFTQSLAQRDPFTNWGFWEQATQGLERIPMGPGSEAIGGTGERTYPEMQQALRDYRAYLYTGTQPASYTLGLIEAMMTGIPVVSIGPSWMRVFPYGPDLFEGHEIAYPGAFSDDPEAARRVLVALLDDPDYALSVSVSQRQRAIDLLGVHTIRPQWADFLGGPVVEFAHERATVTA